MRLIFPHGLGDVIQALPSFRRLAEKCGEPLDVGVLARLPACAEVLDGAPYVKSLFAVADPWRDYEPRDTWQGYESGMLDLARRHGGTLVWTRRPDDPLDPRWCKAFRIADELGVEWQPERPDLSHLERGEDFRHGCIDGVRVRTVMHVSSGNPAKDVALPDVALAPDEVVLPVEGRSLAYTWGLIQSAERFVGVDSGPAHLASCSDVLDVKWIFTTTPIEQAVPLWRPVRVLAPAALVERWFAWRRCNVAMSPHNAVEVVGHTEDARA
jgi:hypothetical protein